MTYVLRKRKLLTDPLTIVSSSYSSTTGKDENLPGIKCLSGHANLNAVVNIFVFVSLVEIQLTRETLLQNYLKID